MNYTYVIGHLSDDQEERVMKTAAAFWDGVAEKYARDPIKNMDNYNNTLERTRGYLRATDTVLEVACGTASTAVLLAPSVASYLATDVSGEMVRIGRQKAQEAGVTSLDLAIGTAFTGSYIDKRFDAVLSFNFIHLADDPQATINAIFDRVQPGGYFISKSACMAEWYKVIRPIIWVMQKIGKAPFLAYFSRAELDQMIRNAGFQIVETRDYTMSPPSHFVVARRPE